MRLAASGVADLTSSDHETQGDPTGDPSDASSGGHRPDGEWDSISIKDRLAHRSKWPWLPTQQRGDLAPHAYDEVTGKVMAAGRRGMDLGGLVNLLANLQRVMKREGLVMTEAQKRLILKELKARDADDAFSLARETQLQIITEVASAYLGVHEDAMQSYLHAC